MKKGKHQPRIGRKTAKKTANGQQLAPPSPRSGYQLPVGNHPDNTGGKPGRSGRKADAFLDELEKIRDELGLPVLRDMLRGKVRYSAIGVCPECGHECKEEKLVDLAKLPQPRDLLRAADMTIKYTRPIEIEVGQKLEDILTASRED